MDLSKYTTMYLQEMRDNLAQLNRHVVTLEKETGNVPLLQEIMRLSHSSKGSSNAMGFKSTAELFHALENVFDAARKGNFTVTKEIISLCLQAFDLIETSFGAIEKTKTEIDCSSLAATIRAAAEKEMKHDPVADKVAPASIAPATNFETATIDFIRVETGKVEKLTNLTGEFALLEQKLAAIKMPSLAPITEQFGKLVDDLTYFVGDIRLVPLEQAFVRFPRLVRDLATTEGKNVRFEMIGTDIALDKTLVDHLVSPLVHLLRNAVDHGIESAEERVKAGKNPEGIIRLSVVRDQGFARVTIEDDGAPIVIEKLKEIARTKGINEATLQGITQDNILDLLSLPGFSSTEKVSEISGRGVGLSAVLQAAKALGGQLTLEHKPGIKRFTVSLPLQLSIIQSLLIEVTKQTYALPLVHVRRLLTIESQNLKSTLGERAAVIDGQDVPLIFLATLFGTEENPSITQANPSNTLMHLVLVDTEHGMIGMVVDGIVGNADIMAKPIGGALKNDTCFTGSTILGSGRVALILDIPGLIQRHSSHWKHRSPPLHS